VDELCASLGADSLAFISIEGLLRSIDPNFSGLTGNGGFCLGCFSGEYPIPVAGEQL
jgi:amidophosphoribosyltransferase